ncbi:hypothetical protein [Luteolibacter sp. LG18]|uniref:LEM-3-like GIY-YIG domain-containing protein n=1 Tax=Luteolibacter sp. LG18 TaxID=2819286 RepID=UPI002B2BF448|nr:hypothetical protein llg_26860 [Luteolibacter sp. LG18]
MNACEQFSEEVAKAIGNYVYRLVDPRNGETFYVGKGKGNRVFRHAAAALEKADEEEIGGAPKYDRILAIRNAHLQVIHVIHRHELSDEAAFEVEAALIDAYPGLTNQQGGHGSGAKGPMSHLQIIHKYSLPVLEGTASEKLVLLNINDLKNRADVASVYEQTRLAWRLSPAKAEQADYVLGVVRGVVVGAFRVDRWLPASRENFPDSDLPLDDPKLSGRYGFIGTPAPPEDWDRYVGLAGKRIVTEAMKHIQNPVRYWGF